jgi:hypothetical protein
MVAKWKENKMMFKPTDYKLDTQNKCLIAKKDGVKHIIYFNGSKFWYKDGKCHRLDGPTIEYNNGTKVWYKDGKRHRLDGPAIEDADGRKVWLKDGKLHRLDGPAVEYANGTKEWWEHGKKIK